MSITPFPSQGQYPWYDQLKNWGADTQTAAENATIAADQAHADAATAQSTADTAVTNAATAQDRADDAFSNAATAQSTADTAVTNAATAQDRADDAFSNAATAQGDATQALADAATADGKAVDAQGDATQALADAATAKGVADKALPIRPIMTGTLLDANTLLASGVYPINVYTSKALNYPVETTYGVLEVYPRVEGASVMQRFTVVSGTGGRTRGEWIRSLADSSWTPWHFIPTQRIDNSAGRAIYTWDDTQIREQLIYGDTGWRVLTSWNAEGEVTGQPLPAGVAPYDGVAGFIRIRREGYSVRYGLAGYKITANSPSFLLPSGFHGGAPKVAYLPSTSSASGMELRTVKIGSLQIYASLRIGDTNADPSYASELEWSTNSPWPTTLPGTAVGTIPRN